MCFRVGNLSLMAALASAGASRLRTPQLLSACAADLLVCAASAPLAATRAARANYLPCTITLYIEVKNYDLRYTTTSTYTFNNVEFAITPLFITIVTLIETTKYLATR